MNKQLGSAGLYPDEAPACSATVSRGATGVVLDIHVFGDSSRNRQISASSLVRLLDALDLMPRSSEERLVGCLAVFDAEDAEDGFGV